MRYVIPAMVLLGACMPVQELCYAPNGRPNYTAYEQAPNRVTPQGINVDDPRLELDLERLDETLDSVLQCLHRVWPRMSPEDRRRAWCIGPPALELRSCLVVQVPPDWYTSPCSGKQVFQCDVPAASCLAKGLTPTPECPCTCRAMMQDQTTVITAPNLELFPARLTELLTGCDQIWSTPLAECGASALVAP